MQFDGLDPFQVGFPTVAVGKENLRFDLHNDADLRELTFDLRREIVRLAWTLREPAWKAPDRSETWQRKVISGVALVFSGVRSVTTQGKILGSADGSDGTVEFLEYSRIGSGIGQVRVVLGSSAEVTIIASRCQLRTIRDL
jgi:hypothetical protein